MIFIDAILLIAILLVSYSIRLDYWYFPKDDMIFIDTILLIAILLVSYSIRLDYWYFQKMIQLG